MNIHSSLANDAGDYLVLAQNEPGEDMTSCTLHLATPAEQQQEQTTRLPRVVIPLSNVRIEEGQPFRLACKIDGSPKPRVTWLKDGQPLLASNRLACDYDLSTCIAALKVTEARPGDVGKYTAVGENAAGVDRTSCEASVLSTSNIDTRPMVDPRSFMYLERPLKQEVRVIGEEAGRPPRFVAHLASHVRVGEGAKLDLKCRLTGYPVPSLVWLKDNEPLHASARVTTSQDAVSGELSVRFDFVKSLDAGVYVCRAENAYGSDETFSEVVIVGERGVDERPQTGNPGVYSLLDVPTQLAGTAGEVAEKQRAPEVVVALGEVRVREEGAAGMWCQIVGCPKPKVTKGELRLVCRYVLLLRGVAAGDSAGIVGVHGMLACLLECFVLVNLFLFC